MEVPSGLVPRPAALGLGMGLESAHYMVLQRMMGDLEKREAENFAEETDKLHSSCSEDEQCSLDTVQPRHYYCGCRRWRPEFLQVFANAKFFTFILCIYSLIEGALVSGFRTIVISSIEKRYHFSSTAASIILGAFDLAVVISVIFISYFGSKAHKPKILGIGLIVQGIGALIFALPQLLFGSYTAGSDAKLRLESCHFDGLFPSITCNPANYAAYAFFVIGDFVLGVGAAPLFTIGTSFIDDIVHPKHVSIHLGIFYAMAIVGPAIGYGLGGAFLSIYVDPMETTTLTQTDPGFVGAWWLCFIFGGAVSILFSVPFLMYPRQLPNSHQVMKARRAEMAAKYSSKFGEERKLVEQMKSFPTHMRKLCQSASWVFITIAASVLFFSLDGMVSFGPKYVESEFGLTASQASLTVGALAIPSGGVGVLAGALIIYLTKSKGRRVAIINCVVAVLVFLPVIGAFLVTCPNLNIAGINTQYANSSDSGSDVLSSSCNSACNCTSSLFEPVCGADGLTYFSPCRAGCANDDPNMPLFENCSCVASNLLLQSNTTFPRTSDLFLGNSTAQDGKCPMECHTLPLFLVLIGIVLFLIFMLKIPTVIITLRCVAEEQRTLALGAQSVCFRLFGTIPSPIVFGAILDSACVYWQLECGIRGNCWVYDNQKSSFRLLFLGSSGLVANCIFAFLAWLFYPKAQPSSRTIAVDDLQLQEELVNSSIADVPGEEEGGFELDTDDVRDQTDHTVLLHSECALEESTTL